MVENKPLLPEMADLWQQTLNWQPSKAQQFQFQRVYELIIEGNRQLNLTRITAPLEFWEKHLWDSLRGIAPLLKVQTASQSQDQLFKVIDIGTGAGFPGVPVAIALYPNWQITLLDSTGKKIAFLNTLITQMEIQNAHTLIARAEIIAKQRQYRETYDFALMRAIGSVNICAEYALPLLKPGGLTVLYRGNWTLDEEAVLQKAIKYLGGAIEAIEQFTTPLSNSIRHCVYLRKVADS